MRFWRPPLYHWSYWPSTTCLRHSTPARPPAKPSASAHASVIRLRPGRRQSRRPPHMPPSFDSGPAAGKAVGLRSTSLLRLLVVRVLAAARTELRLDQLVGHGPLVLGGAVVTLLDRKSVV